MDNYLFIIMGTLMGIVFGVALEKSGVLDPDAIIGQLQLRRFTMLRVFLSAIITGLIVYLILHYLGYQRLNWKTMAIGPDILGGILLGVGIAFAGACPGTVFGQIGIGYKDALVVLMGAFFGVFIFLNIKEYLISCLPVWPGEKYTLDAVISVDFYTATLYLVVLLVLVLLGIKKLPE